MKIVLERGGLFILRFDPREDVIAELAAFAGQKEIHAGIFTGIGSAESIVLSYYNLERREYEDHEIEKRLEIASLIGNLALVSGATAVHAHGVFSGRDLSTIAGHVKKLIVSATCEIALHLPGGSMARTYAPEIGLNLLA